MYVFHSKPLPSGKRVTLAANYNEENSSLNIATSRCSPKDQFSKKLGRIIAEGRLEKNGPEYRVALPSPPSYKEFSTIAAEFVAEHYH